LKKFFFIIVFFLVSVPLYSRNYFVNDVMDGNEKWCTQPGNNSNSGLTTNSPKASITNLLSTYHLTNNDIVYIDSGIYNECVRITNKGTSSGYIVFTGAGSNTLITGQGGNSWQDGCTTLTNAQYIKLKKLKFKFYNRTLDCYGIYAKGSRYIIIQSNIVLSNRRSGIRLDNCSYSTVVNNVTLNNNLAEDTWPAGIQLSEVSKFNYIKNNVINSNARGIFLENSSSNIVVSNFITYNSNGIFIDSLSGYNFFTGNIIFNNFVSGADIENNTIGIEFIKNRIYNNTGPGILGNGCDSISIISNYIYNNGGDGISMENNTNSYISFNGNNIYSNSGAGINVNGEAAVVRMSYIYCNGKWGIRIDGFNGAPITNEFNISSFNTWEGILIDNAGTGSLIKNCTLFKNGADGIDITSGTIIVRNCLSVSNTLVGYQKTGGTLLVKYSVSYGNLSGDFSTALVSNSMVTNPMFKSVSLTDPEFLNLSGWSPCINAGDPDDKTIGEGIIDIGAKEYDLPGLPVINYLSPVKIKIGDTLFIYGSNFETEQYYSVVSFSNSSNGKIDAVQYLSWSDNLIQVKVPEGLTPGSVYSVIVKTRTGTGVKKSSLEITDETQNENSISEEVSIWNNMITDIEEPAKIILNLTRNSGKVIINIYDIRGRMVRKLIDSDINKISFPLEWDGKDSDGHRVAPGVYFIYVISPEYKVMKKIFVVY